MPCTVVVLSTALRCRRSVYSTVHTVESMYCSSTSILSREVLDFREKCLTKTKDWPCIICNAGGFSFLSNSTAPLGDQGVYLCRDKVLQGKEHD